METTKKQKAALARYRAAPPEAITASNKKRDRKGGEYYEAKLEYDRTGLRRERRKIRRNHARKWAFYKNIIAPGSQIHHEWIQGTADFRGVALVDTDRHMHGYIDVIHILRGKITLFEEEFLRNGVQ